MTMTYDNGNGFHKQNLVFVGGVNVNGNILGQILRKRISLLGSTLRTRSNEVRLIYWHLLTLFNITGLLKQSSPDCGVTMLTYVLSVNGDIFVLCRHSILRHTYVFSVQENSDRRFFSKCIAPFFIGQIEDYNRNFISTGGYRKGTSNDGRK